MYFHILYVECVFSVVAGDWMSEWMDAKKYLPEEPCEILFIAEEGVTDERTGIFDPVINMVLLKHTDFPANKLLWWIRIPEIPQND